MPKRIKLRVRTYRVSWDIDIEAHTPEAAARQALKIQRDPDSIATVFDVHHRRTTHRVDLTEKISTNQNTGKSRRI